MPPSRAAIPVKHQAIASRCIWGETLPCPAGKNGKPGEHRRKSVRRAVPARTKFGSVRAVQMILVRRDFARQTRRGLTNSNNTPTTSMTAPTAGGIK